jgi:NAD(P)-dependent dehydrogenase (short-subunit alcohol dehydrogenase family)
LAEATLIVGAGSGLSAALARLFTHEGMRVALASRDTGKLDTLLKETGARAYACDATKLADVDGLFDAFARDFGPPDIVVYNAGYRTRGAISDLDPEEVRKTLMASAYGGFLVAQLAAKAMLARGQGTILLTGASASVKGYARSAPFAMGKFALRGLAQSLARELHPQNIHVGHVVIDGGIGRAGDKRADERGPDGMLDPDAIAAAYLGLHRQHRSAWAWEIELRPWRENF